MLKDDAVLTAEFSRKWNALEGIANAQDEETIKEKMEGNGEY